MHTTGEEKKLSRPYNDFSKSNWADHSEFREGGVEVKIRTTSNILSMVQKLKDRQWEKIITAAKESIRKGKSSEKDEAADGPSGDTRSSPAPSIELIDDDEELQ